MSENTMPPQTTNGTGRGSGRQSANRGRQNTRGRRPTHNKNGSNVAFEGVVKEMNGHVFQLYGVAVRKNQFMCTVKELTVYLALHFKHHPANVKRIIVTMNDTKIKVPDDVQEGATRMRIKIWGKEIALHIHRKEAYKCNKCALYSLMWGQCSKGVQAKVKATSKYKSMAAQDNSLWLLKMIKAISFKFETQENICMALHNAKCLFYSCRQEQNESNTCYMLRLKNHVKVIQNYGGNVGDDDALIDTELQKLSKKD